MFPSGLSSGCLVFCYSSGQMLTVGFRRTQLADATFLFLFLGRVYHFRRTPYIKPGALTFAGGGKELIGEKRPRLLRTDVKKEVAVCPSEKVVARSVWTVAWGPCRVSSCGSGRWHINSISLFLHYKPQGLKYRSALFETFSPLWLLQTSILVLTDSN